jgi:hypothetical protein
MTGLINYSEFNTLTDCEKRWYLGFVDNEEDDSSKRGLHLGTLCHLWHGRWLMGSGATLPSSWTDDINTGGKPGEERTLKLTDFDPALVERAQWLAARFVEHYGPEPPSSWTVISAEEWMTREFTWGTLVGRTDGFVEIDGRLWLIEVKSYGSRPGPLAYAHVSPQLGCYSLLAEAHYGQRPWGILYQGMYTYQWKPTKPTQKSVLERWADTAAFIRATRPGDEACRQALRRRLPQLDRAPGCRVVRPGGGRAGRRAPRHRCAVPAWRAHAAHAPARHPDEVLPSVGRHCLGCGFKARCWNELGGIEPFEIEVDDDDAEPV